MGRDLTQDTSHEALHNTYNICIGPSQVLYGYVIEVVALIRILNSLIWSLQNVFL